MIFVVVSTEVVSGFMGINLVITEGFKSSTIRFGMTMGDPDVRFCLRMIGS